MKKVLVIFGGVSSEHEVSLVSASSVIGNIPRSKYDVLMMGITKEGKWFLFDGSADDLPNGKWETMTDKLTPAVLSPDRSCGGIIMTDSGKSVKIDVIFPVLHGKNGEDGTMQGLFRLSGIPFVGCDTLASAVCMDKAMTNTISDYYGIEQAKWRSTDVCSFRKAPEKTLEDIAAYLGFPIFVKPANAGSSVGITRACTMAELKEAVEVAFVHDKKIVFEEAIVGYEVECAVLGNDEPVASVVGEIVPCNEFYDYDAKYLANKTELHIPARLSPEKLEEVRSAACRAYRALGCSGMARVDFFVRKSDGKVLFNEPNTLPGFTSISMYPKLFAASGIEYPELLDRLITLAFER